MCRIVIGRCCVPRRVAWDWGLTIFRRIITRHWVDAAMARLPLIEDVYTRYSARLKRYTCLALHRAGRLRPSAFVLWVVTYECNFRCAFCEARAGERSEGELTTAEGKALLDDMARLKVRQVMFSGGEPAVRPDLPELLEHAGRLAMTPALISNGSLIGERWDELRRFRYYLYFTSLDDLPRWHDQARAPGSFDKAVGALELFASAGTPVRVVNTLVHPGNLVRLGELGAELERSGATDWRLTPVFPVGRSESRPESQMSGEHLRTMVEFVHDYRSARGLRVELAESCSYLNCLAEKPSGRPFFCGAGLNRCAVMPNGDVLACGQAYHAARPEGNVRELPLSTIWREAFTAFRSTRPPAGCQGCEFWGACQGGCWAQREIQGSCFRDAWLSGAGQGCGGR